MSSVFFIYYDNIMYYLFTVLFYNEALCHFTVLQKAIIERKCYFAMQFQVVGKLSKLFTEYFV